MSNRRNQQFTFNPHNKATRLDCQFTVAAADTGGFGVTGLNKGGRISTVFMHTSATPGRASNGQLNPNPASGYIVVTLADNYNSLLGMSALVQSAVTGSAITVSTGSSLTVGVVYQIVTLGTTTQAQWVTLGLSSSITAAPGVTFVSALTSGTGTGTVKALAASGIDHVEVLGGNMGAKVSGVLQPYSMNNKQVGSSVSRGVGSQIILACYAAGTLTAPANGSVISLFFEMNDSAQGV